MFKLLTFFLFVATYSVNALSSESSLEDIPEQLLNELREVSDLQSISDMRLVDKRFESLADHNFDVILEDGSKLTIVDYLREKQRRPIIDVKNLVTLLKVSPNAFIELMLKSIPYSPESIESNLQPFHQNTFKVAELVGSLPNYETGQEKLAGTIIELFMWDQIRAQVWAQVWAQVNVELGMHVRNQVWAQVWNEFKAQDRAQVWNQIRDQVKPQVWAQVSDQIWPQLIAQVSDHIKHQVWLQVSKDLKHFHFGLAFEEGYLNETLKISIYYVFTVYQIGTLAMRHTDAFQNFHSIMMSILQANHIDDSMCKNILRSIILSNEPEENYLLDTQINLIKRIILAQ